MWPERGFGGKSREKVAELPQGAVGAGLEPTSPGSRPSALSTTSYLLAFQTLPETGSARPVRNEAFSSLPREASDVWKGALEERWWAQGHSAKLSMCPLQSWDRAQEFLPPWK